MKIGDWDKGLKYGIGDWELKLGIRDVVVGNGRKE